MRETQLPSASIVVVSYNSVEFLPACLDSIAGLDREPLEVIVVDNASGDGSAELVESRFPDVILIRSPRNLGYAGGANIGLRRARGDVLCVLNPDVVLAPGWLRETVGALASDEKAGIAGGKLLYPDGRTIQHAGGVLARPSAATRHVGYGERDEGQYNVLERRDFVTGAAIAVKRRVLEALGYFDEQFFPAYFEEPDLCLRAAGLGYDTLYVPAAVAVHHESATVEMRSEEYFYYHHRNRLRFVAKHWGLEELLAGFLGSEKTRLRGTMPPADRRGSDKAYREAAMNGVRQAGGATPPAAEAEQAYFDSLRRDVEALQARWLVREQPFRSSVPVLGRLIVFVRERINNVATRWYLQPILQQQVEFNQAAARAVAGMERQAEDANSVMTMSAALVHERLGQMERSTGERLKSIEERLERLEGLLESVAKGRGED